MQATTNEFSDLAYARNTQLSKMGLGLEDDRGSEQGGEQPVEPDEDQPICRPQPEPGRCRPLQHKQLLAEECPLGFAGRLRSEQSGEKSGEQLQEIQRWAKRDSFGTTLMAATDELSAPDDKAILFRLKRPFPLLTDALGKFHDGAPVLARDCVGSQGPGRRVRRLAAEDRPQRRRPGDGVGRRSSSTFSDRSDK
jgi:hypothetical protein